MQNGEYWKDGVVPWISSSDVKSTHLHSTGSRVTNLAITEKATTLVPRGSVVLVTRSGILRRFLPVAITLVPMAINQDIRALLPSQAVLPAFALQMLVFHDSGIRSACMKSGTTVESLEMKWLKAYRVGMPTPAEQAAIAEVLADLDADLDATTAKLDKARAIKQGMMQELLTGRIRLV
jgi:type I restriction enzyme S subunit